MNQPSPSALSRRSLLIGTATATGAALATGGLHAAEAAASSCAASAVKTYSSADFYGADGAFLVDKAREAYYDMFRRFQYPISDKLQKEMWILDFGLNDFAHVGTARVEGHLPMLATPFRGMIERSIAGELSQALA